MNFTHIFAFYSNPGHRFYHHQGMYLHVLPTKNTAVKFASTSMHRRLFALYNLVLRLWPLSRHRFPPSPGTDGHQGRRTANESSLSQPLSHRSGALVSPLPATIELANIIVGNHQLGSCTESQVIRNWQSCNLKDNKLTSRPFQTPIFSSYSPTHPHGC